MKPEELERLDLSTNFEMPEDGIPVARINLTLDNAKREPDGTWVVIRTVKGLITFDNELYFVREASVKAMDKTFSKASSTTHAAIGRILAEYDDDLWSKEEWNGMEYALKADTGAPILEQVEVNYGISEDVSDTKT